MAAKGAVVGDNNDRDKDDYDTHEKDNSNKGFDVVKVFNVISKIPKKSKSLRSLFLIPEAKREAKDARHRERRAKIKRRANEDKTTSAVLTVSTSLTARTADMNAATTALLVSYAEA